MSSLRCVAEDIGVGLFSGAFIDFAGVVVIGSASVFEAAGAGWLIVTTLTRVSGLLLFAAPVSVIVEGADGAGFVTASVGLTGDGDVDFGVVLRAVRIRSS